MKDKITVRSRAPLRLGLGGGGSDLSPFCDEFGGFVLNASIGMFVYAIVETRADGKVCFVGADRQETFTWDCSLEMPMDGVLPLHKALYWRIMRDFNHGVALPLTLTTYSDVPPGSGLGSSSTMVVAMVEAFKELLSLPLGEYEVAQLAYRIERIDAGMHGGKQDQYAATFGGFNFMEFFDNDRVIVNPLRIKASIVSELESSLVLYDTGVSRDSEAIITDQITRIRNRDPQTIAAMQALKCEAVEMKEALLKGQVRQLAGILQRGWESKKRTAGLVSNQELERIYSNVISAGAYTGKVSGAGGGGFMMFLVDPARRPDVWRALRDERGAVVRVQFTDQGSVGWHSR